VPVLPDDTAESLAARVFAAECAVLPEAIARIATAARRSASYHSQTILPEASACTVHSAT